MEDFNYIQYDGERIGGHPRPIITMEDFNNCIDNFGVVELKSFGGNMTWTNGQEGRSRKWAKLDQALVNLPFIQQFNLARLEFLVRKSLDDKPMLILFAQETSRYGLAPFWYQNMWYTHEKFLDFIKHVWMESVHGGASA